MKLITISVLIVSSMSFVWGKKDEGALEEKYCDKDDYTTRCMVCVGIPMYATATKKTMDTCDPRKLTKEQEEMRQDMSWMTSYDDIKKKCDNEYMCTCEKKCDSGGGGDPHFRTLDGTLYSYHGECDLVMASSTTYASGLGLDIHARTSIVGDWSLISNVAVRIGDDTFELANDGTHYLNGDSAVELPIALSGKYIVTKGEDTIKSWDDDKEHMKQVMYTIELENKDKIILSNFKTMISVNVQGQLEGTHGMLGTAGVDGKIGRDGVTKYGDVNLMGADWQVNPEVGEPMLFQDIGSGPQYPEQCIVPLTTGRRLRQHSEQSRRRAKEVCDNASADLIEKCIEDVLLTGDLDIAHGYAF